jgi:hypothetical protein
MLAVETTQWIIAVGSLGSALIALALGLGLKDWVFRPRVRLVLRHESDPDEISDRVVTKRLGTGEDAAFVRLRVDNGGRTTARNVGVRILKVHRWDPGTREWARTRPELDGRLLQPSNHLASEPSLLDVFPHTDRIVDLASLEFSPTGGNASYVEISQPWPPNQANALEPGTSRLELLLCGDNITPERTFVALTFDGMAMGPDDGESIWEHFLVHGPSPELSEPPNPTNAASQR